VQSGAAVVPAYVHGTGRAWPRGRRLPRPVKVRVTFGAPLRFERATGAERKGQYEAASRQMMTAIAELRDRTVGGVGVARARRPLQIH
jgi:1-acyl-sn-glycerol-3-phosphate acyltransferase